MHISLIAALAFGLLAGPALADSPDFQTPKPTWTQSDWNAFSENLIVGLRGDNDGVKASALQLIVQYGDRLDVRAARFDVARLYRSHGNERMRRLAAVACSRLNDEWAMGFLRMSEPFERSGAVLHTVRALLAEHDARKQAPR